jgi:hypothetical protein
MPLDPIWKRALKAVVEIKDPPPPPPVEPIPQSSYDELDGALTIQERREARQRLNPRPPLPASLEPVIGGTDSPVDADGLVNFERLYQIAGVPIVPFTAEQALDMLHNMPAGVSEDSRQQIINVTLAALGKSVGGTPEAIVVDATRKQAALKDFRRTRGDQLVELTSAAENRMADLQREIAKSQAIIEKAKHQYDTLAAGCQTEEARLDTVVDFFSDTPAPR